MSKLLMSIAIVALLSVSFAGCAKKGGDGTVGPGNLDENAVYDEVLASIGFQVAGGLNAAGVALLGGDNGSAASAKVVDVVTDDTGGAQDKADFLVDVRTANGSRVQAQLRSMSTGADANLGSDLQGGAGNNVQVFGSTGLGPSEFPETKSYLTLFGLSRVKIGNDTLERSHFTQVFVTRGIRDDAGALLTSVDANDLEMHILVGSTAGNASAGAGPSPLPDVADGFLYYYFENVKLSQLEPDEKAEVGKSLRPPEKPNIPPIVVARILLANGTAATSAVLVAPTPGNLTVFLDGTLSQDSDGTIEAYSWDVRQVNGTGMLEPAGNQSKPSGPNVTFTFTTPGLKVIGLRIIDSDGGIANTTTYFFINYNLKGSHDFGAGTGSVVGAGQDVSQAPNVRCTEPNNCNKHTFQVGYGAQKLEIKQPTKTSGGTTQCTTSHVDVYAPPARTKMAGDNKGTRTFDAAALAGKVGKWEIEVWYEAQVQCAYTIDVTVTYTPLPGVTA